MSVSAPLSSRDFWTRPRAERAAHFAELRAIAPVSLHEPSAFTLAPQRRGFWAVTRHADVQHVSRNPALFCSGQGVGLGDLPPDILELNASFLVMDPPQHTVIRRIVSGAFTPRRVARFEADITTEARRIVDEFVDRGGDVVEDLAMKLPLWAISTMMGVPESMRAEFYRAAEGQIAAQDPEYARAGKDSATFALEAAMTLHRLAAELVADRRAHPGDDILSTLVTAQIDGEPLDEQLLRSIFVLFATAGNDTTRTSTSQGVRLFAENPDQWRRLRADPTLLPSAIEEVVRYATPVIHFRRTATQDTELAGAQIAAGDPVVMFYESANFDETVFDAPETFDITRDPNPHLGFGGGGTHFCLGASLARSQLRALFTRLAERAETIEAGQAAYLTSNFVNGIKRMPVTITAS
ncbi:cytochrome P450 [Frankia sp. AgB1.9]|uniref:cytochrome P450 n=1 Tax=unclassified Frankia TaxID=2632575 RepID=UPI001933954A|nr:MULTISPECIES: cytochrome P450 [unclassified Frankia]MBL7550725.1 cytochrome P450 [Frankia sp. AgB1.9]MBL7624342.1 cytochrome P450 [Frankia sp. AgB1.8]